MPTRLVVAKFGGSALSSDGESIPKIVKRIESLGKDSKVIAVFSAPLTIADGVKRSLTDVVLAYGKKTKEVDSLDIARTTYRRILENYVDHTYQDECSGIIKTHLDGAQNALDTARSSGEFTNETRSMALALSGEILMSHVMKYVLRGHKIKTDSVEFDDWPIITDDSIESANFLVLESQLHMQAIASKVKDNDVVTMGGFIGKTTSGVATTYERGGTDRTAADLGILFHKEYDTSIDFEKDSIVVSADPKIVSKRLRSIYQLSYNEARLAGMFGMKILDPIAIKDIVENGVDMPIRITDIATPSKITVIKRVPDDNDEDTRYPIKIVTGKSNCAIFRIETNAVQKLLISLEKDKRYSEFVILSPFIKDNIPLSRLLFLDGDYVRNNEKYLRGFDPLATITYNRGVITLIGDEMWRVQQVASRTIARVGNSGLNILNIDAQEETSKIIIVIEDSGNNIAKAISSIHDEISEMDFPRTNSV